MGVISPFPAALVLTLVLATDSAAQSWEVDLRQVRFDHPPVSNAAPTGDRLPDGYGVAARVLVPGTPLFIEASLSRGSDERPGAICGGLVGPGSCVQETVKYKSRAALLSVGWPASFPLTDRVRADYRPRVGLGVLQAVEEGRETGRRYSEPDFAVSAGISLGVGVLPFEGGPWVTFSTEMAWIWPRRANCEDCRDVLRRRTRHLTNAIGVGGRGWNRP